MIHNCRGFRSRLRNRQTKVAVSQFTAAFRWVARAWGAALRHRAPPLRSPDSRRRRAGRLARRASIGWSGAPTALLAPIPLPNMPAAG